MWACKLWSLLWRSAWVLQSGQFYHSWTSFLHLKKNASPHTKGNLKMLLNGTTGSKKSGWSDLNVTESRFVQSHFVFFFFLIGPPPLYGFIYQIHTWHKSSDFGKCFNRSVRSRTSWTLLPPCTCVPHRNRPVKGFKWAQDRCRQSFRRDKSVHGVLNVRCKVQGENCLGGHGEGKWWMEKDGSGSLTWGEKNSVYTCFFLSVLEGVWGLTLVKFISLTNLMFKCY